MMINEKQAAFLEFYWGFTLTTAGFPFIFIGISTILLKTGKDYNIKTFNYVHLVQSQ